MVEEVGSIDIQNPFRCVVKYADGKGFVFMYIKWFMH